MPSQRSSGRRRNKWIKIRERLITGVPSTGHLTGKYVGPLNLLCRDENVGIIQKLCLWIIELQVQLRANYTKMIGRKEKKQDI